MAWWGRASSPFPRCITPVVFLVVSLNSSLGDRSSQQAAWRPLVTNSCGWLGFRSKIERMQKPANARLEAGTFSTIYMRANHIAVSYPIIHQTKMTSYLRVKSSPRGGIPDKRQVPVGKQHSVELS